MQKSQPHEISVGLAFSYCEFKMEKKRFIGDTAVILGVLSYIPLIWRVCWQRTTHSLSYPWIILSMVAGTLWLCYGVANKFAAIKISAVLSLIADFVLLITKVRLEILSNTNRIDSGTG